MLLDVALESLLLSPLEFVADELLFMSPEFFLWCFLWCLAFVSSAGVLLVAACEPCVWPGMPDCPSGLFHVCPAVFDVSPEDCANAGVAIVNAVANAMIKSFFMCLGPFPAKAKAKLLPKITKGGRSRP